MDYYTNFFKFLSDFSVPEEPTIDDVRIDIYNRLDDLTKNNNNYPIFFMFNASNYLNFLTDDQRYFLFVSSCLHNSIDIMKILLSTNIDKKGIKNFMSVYLTEVNEFEIFKWIYENKKIKFNEDELYDLFFSIINTNNINFINWFIKLNIFDFYKHKNIIIDFINKNKINKDIKELFINI